MAQLIRGRVLLPGKAEGEALVTQEPLSFWGGLDPRTGEVIDRRHPLSGACVSGKVLVFPSGRGSSTGSSILLEAVRLNSAPAAMILSRPDQILALGAIVAQELYQKSLPIVVVSDPDFAQLQKARHVQLDQTGSIWWE